jgi:hypothetical protein
MKAPSSARPRFGEVVSSTDDGVPEILTDPSYRVGRGDDAATHRQLRHRGRARGVAPAQGRAFAHQFTARHSGSGEASLPPYLREPASRRSTRSTPTAGSAPARARRHARRRHRRAPDVAALVAGRASRRRWRAARCGRGDLRRGLFAPAKGRAAPGSPSTTRHQDTLLRCCSSGARAEVLPAPGAVVRTSASTAWCRTARGIPSRYAR